MKMTKIATAKLRRTFFELIETGTKRHEVRSTSLDGVDAFYFVDSETHEPLGIFRVIDVFKIDRLDDDVAIKLAAIGQDEFYSLFPRPADGGPEVLWVAKLGENVTLDALLREDA